MNQIEIAKELNLAVGEIFHHINGGKIRVSRLTEKSVFVEHYYEDACHWSKEHRESFNSVKGYIEKCRWLRKK